MIFKQLIDEEGCMSYLIGSEEDKVAAVIDPEHDVEKYLILLQQLDLKLKFIIDTHTHVDHDSMAGELARQTGARTVMYRTNPAQRQAGSGYQGNQKIKGHLTYNAGLKVDLLVDDGEELSLGNLKLRVLHTPGHTQDSISIVLPGRVLTGDALMIGHCGRTDLPGGDAAALYHSLFDRLLPLGDDVLVYPAHEYKGNVNTTIGYERVNNPFLKPRGRGEFVQFAREMASKIPEGDKIQCSIPSEADVSPAPKLDVAINPLMGQMCGAMEYYFKHVPFHWNLVTPAEMLDIISGEHEELLLDVRTREEYARGHIPGTINIPVQELTARVNELREDREKPIITVCSSGVRSAYAAMFLRGYGYTHVKSLDLGMHRWAEMGYPVDYNQ